MNTIGSNKTGSNKTYRIKKRQMTAYEYNYLISELKGIVIGQFVRKISEVSKAKFLIRFDRDVLSIHLPYNICITRYIEEAPKRPSGFVMLLRKRLKGKRLTLLEQYGTDRVIIMRFAHAPTQEPISLIAEMFSHGNLILIDEKGMIVGCYRKETWRDRTIAPGERYRFPVSAQYPFNPQKGLFKELLDDRYIIADLSSLPIGSYYAKEILLRCGIDEKRTGASLTDQQIEAIVDAIDSVVSSPQPYAEHSDSVLTEFALIKMSHWKDPRQYDSFNRLIDEYYKPSQEYEVSTYLKKLETRLKKQKEHLQTLEKEEKEYKKAGDFIYLHFDELSEIIKNVREGKQIKRKGVSFDKKRGVIEIDTERFE